ncbi:hypothetical protein HK096_010676, partial [Nowakowskiella sp. JEL0078]
SPKRDRKSLASIASRDNASIYSLNSYNSFTSSLAPNQQNQYLKLETELFFSQIDSPKNVLVKDPALPRSKSLGNFTGKKSKNKHPISHISRHGSLLSLDSISISPTTERTHNFPSSSGFNPLSLFHFPLASLSRNQNDETRSTYAESTFSISESPRRSVTSSTNQNLPTTASASASVRTIYPSSINPLNYMQPINLPAILSSAPPGLGPTNRLSVQSTANSNYSFMQIPVSQSPQPYISHSSQQHFHVGLNSTSNTLTHTPQESLRRGHRTPTLDGASIYTSHTALSFGDSAGD